MLFSDRLNEALEGLEDYEDVFGSPEEWIETAREGKELRDHQ